LTFTDSQIKSLKPTGKTLDIREAQGFGIRVQPSGVKTWFYIYRFDGKRRFLNLGHYPALPLTKARSAHRKALDLVEQGIDPLAAKQEKKRERISAPTVQQLSEEYIEKHAKPNKKSWKADQRTLDADILPAIGKRKAKDITRREVVLLLEKIAERAPVLSNRVLALLRKMFNFAVQRGILNQTPCSNIARIHKEKPKDRSLSKEEVKTLWSDLDTLNIRAATRNALKLILVTAQRPSEVCEIRWEEIDGQWWTIPANRAKNGKEHRVYLSPLALELLGKPAKKGFVLPGTKKDRPVSVFTINTALYKNIDIIHVDKFTPHDLRRTAATHMASLGHGVVVDKILNHVDRRVTAIYDRYSYDKEKQLAFESWGRKLQAIITGKEDKVVPLINKRKTQQG